jgi:site-specific DNA recombinase
MRVAIYARYSSENQSEKSIDDQIRVCQKYIEANNLHYDPKHSFTDEAVSGSIINRPGLLALERAIENKQIDAVAVDDLSRLSRSNHQMLTLVNKFNFHQIKIISVSDGIISDDDNSKLGIHIRGLINELYLDDLRKKTMRGLEGQRLRGYSTGENVYEYKTCPVGELRLNKKGQPKYEGKIHQINDEESAIVKRIYLEFTNGKSIHAIVQGLNQDNLPTKKNHSGGWATSTVSRILKNEKYAGYWIWRKTKNVRDPMTGKMKKVDRPEHEQLKSFKEDLAIIDLQIWESAKERWIDMEGAWPMRTPKQKASSHQKSYIHSNPTHLFAGQLQCKCCGGAIVQVCGKAGGYYGCHQAKRKTCSNKLTIPRKRLEDFLLKSISQNLLNTENIKYIFEHLEKEIAKTLGAVPEELKLKRQEYEKIQQELQNLLNFIKIGNFSKVVSEALSSAESRSEKIKNEMQALEFQRTNAFKAPPKEWVDHKLEQLVEILNLNTKASALALKDLLGTIELEPVAGECTIECGKVIQNRPFYMAYTTIDTLVLLDEYKSTNWSLLRKR